jgi:ribonuclease P protein component
LLPKKNRLFLKSDFEKVFFQGKSIDLPEFRIKLLFTKNNQNRFGIIIGRKVIALATKRNRLKRQLRAILYSFLPDFKKSFDAVLIVKKDLAQKSFKEIKEILKKVFLEQNLFNK